MPLLVFDAYFHDYILPLSYEILMKAAEGMRDNQFLQIIFDICYDEKENVPS